MDDLGTTLQAMDSTRLLLALLFVSSYASAIGRLVPGPVRRWSAGLAVLMGLAFTGLTDPWVHGALMVAFGVLGIGGFVVLAWLFSAGAQQWQVKSLALAAAAPAALPPAQPSRMYTLAYSVQRMRRRFSTQ